MSEQFRKSTVMSNNEYQTEAALTLKALADNESECRPRYNMQLKND